MSERVLMILLCGLVLVVAVTSAAGPTAAPFVCPEELPGACYSVRSPFNCSVYYSCHFAPLIYVNVCPDGLVFSQSACVCVHTYSIYNDCGDETIYGGRYNDPLCNARPNGTNIHPLKCNWFIPCFMYNSYAPMPCPDGQGYDFELNQCVPRGLVARCAE